MHTAHSDDHYVIGVGRNVLLCGTHKDRRSVCNCGV